MEAKRYQDCGPYTRELVATVHGDEIRPHWCPGDRTRCDTTDANSPCQWCGAWIGKGQGLFRICCHFGLDSDDGAGDWGVDSLPGLLEPSGQEA